MKIGWNLSNSLLRSEIFNRANKSFGTSIGLSFWRRLRLLIGFVLCSVGVLLALAGLSKSVTGTIRDRGASCNYLEGGRPPAASTPHAIESHGDVAAQRQGARRRGLDSAGGTRERGTLRSGDRNLDGHRQPQHRTRSITPRRCCLTARCSSQAEHGSGLHRERGTLRSGNRDLDGHRQPRHCTRCVTRRHCCPTARCSSQAVVTVGGWLASAELYDPAAGPGRLPAASSPTRAYHTATLLAQRQGARGRRCQRGAAFDERGTLRSGERDLDAPPAASSHARESHTATLLPNGKVLVAGGIGTPMMLSQRGTLRSGDRDLDARPAASTTAAILTPRRCCPTARCSSLAV